MGPGGKEGRREGEREGEGERGREGGREVQREGGRSIMTLMYTTRGQEQVRHITGIKTIAEERIVAERHTHVGNTANCIMVAL